MKECRAYRWDLLPKVPRSTVAIIRGLNAQLGDFDPAAAEAALGQARAAAPGTITAASVTTG